MIHVEQSPSEPGRVTIRLAGEVGGPTAQSLRRVLSDASSNEQVVIDLTNPVFVDHAVVGAIAAAARGGVDGGAGIWLICPRPGLLQVLREARILDSVRVLAEEKDLPPLVSLTVM